MVTRRVGIVAAIVTMILLPEAAMADVWKSGDSNDRTVYDYSQGQQGYGYYIPRKSVPYYPSRTYSYEYERSSTPQHDEWDEIDFQLMHDR